MDIKDGATAQYISGLGYRIEHPEACPISVYFINGLTYITLADQVPGEIDLDATSDTESHRTAALQQAYQFWQLLSGQDARRILRAQEYVIGMPANGSIADMIRAHWMGASEQTLLTERDAKALELAKKISAKKRVDADRFGTGASSDRTIADLLDNLIGIIER